VLLDEPTAVLLPLVDGLERVGGRRNTHPLGGHSRSDGGWALHEAELVHGRLVTLLAGTITVIIPLSDGAHRQVEGISGGHLMAAEVLAHGLVTVARHGDGCDGRRQRRARRSARLTRLKKLVGAAVLLERANADDVLCLLQSDRTLPFVNEFCLSAVTMHNVQGRNSSFHGERGMNLSPTT
jgi:hypothetical protein